MERWNVDVEPMIGQFSPEREFMMAGDAEYDYEVFEKIDPESPTKAEICGHLRSKKASLTPSDRRRFRNIFPQQIKESSNNVTLLTNVKETTFLKFLVQPKPAL